MIFLDVYQASYRYLSLGLGGILGGVVESEGMMEWDIRYRKRLPACFVISWKGMFMWGERIMRMAFFNIVYRIV